MRQGQLVPAAIAPEAVHRVSYFYHRQVAVQRQVSVIGRAYIGLLIISGYGAVIILYHTLFIQSKGALEEVDIALALKHLDQVQYGRLAIVEGDIVQKLEYPCIAQAAQLGIGIAAAEADLDVGMMLFDILSAAQTAVQIAGKWRRKPHQCRLVQGQLLLQYAQQYAIGKGWWCL
ncbi:hypothetical protein D3C86_1375830 [compost metagenome]